MSPDKIAHLKAGAQAAAFGAGLGAGVGVVAAPLLAVQPLTTVLVLLCAAAGALTSATTAGLTKEYADKMDNEIHPGMHGVEIGDAVATAAPGWALAAALVFAAYRVLA